MKKFAAVAASIAIAGVGLAAPAQAYDRELYSYAAGHMIDAKDVPAPLSVKKGGDFGAFPSGKTNFLCGDADKQVSYPGGNHQFNMGYDGRKGGMGVTVNVTQYASAQKAIKAFNDLKKGLKECEGPASGQQTFDDGSTDSWSRLNTTGNVPLVTVAGVQSVFLNQNYEDVTTGEGAGTYSSDTYNVYTLVNDVIISTFHYSGSELNMSTKERRAVNQVAFNAVTRWVD
ncbi:MAG: hypothetical protein O2815_12415 [Actinomycetota bacterium]|nr:hypothetical protein [Actinomycetota bacterium]